MTIPISPDPPPNVPLPEPGPPREDDPVRIVDLPPNSPTPGLPIEAPKLPS